MWNISTSNSHWSFSELPHTSSISVTSYVYKKKKKIWNKIKTENHRQMREQGTEFNTCTKIILFLCCTQQYPYIKLMSKKIYVRSSLYLRSLLPFPLK
jgi:hypothetical protein